MLFTPYSKHKNNLTFAQQLKSCKQQSYTPPQLKKQADTYQLTMRILQLLIDKNPKLTDQLFMLRSSIKNWYEHNKQQSINRIRQIFNLRQNLVVRVKKEIGVVLEQIAYYLRNVVQQYDDLNVEVFYVKYLNAIKKLDWGTAANQQQHTELMHTEVQTQNNAFFRPTRSQISIDQTIETLDSPNKKERQFNIQKYLNTKQENLDLQRKNDLLTQMMAKKEEQNKKLKLQIEKLIYENDEYKDDQENYIKEVDKLSKILQKIKGQNDQREGKQDLLKMTFGCKQNKFEKLGDLKVQLHKQLASFEQNLQKLHSQPQGQFSRHKDNFFSHNFRVTQQDQQLPTIKKQNKLRIQDFDQQPQQQSEIHRMIYLQALTIEDQVIPLLSASKQKKLNEKKYSHQQTNKSNHL